MWKEKNGTMHHYQFQVLPFGLVCSPAIQIEVIEMIIEDLPKDVNKIAKCCFYMNDIIIGSEDQELLKKVMNIMKESFKEASFTK